MYLETLRRATCGQTSFATHQREIKDEETASNLLVVALTTATQSSSLLELGVALHKFFGAAAGEADGKAAVLIVALDADDGSDSKTGMADFAPEHGVGVGPAFRS